MSDPALFSQRFPRPSQFTTDLSFISWKYLEILGNTANFIPYGWTPLQLVRTVSVCYDTAEESVWSNAGSVLSLFLQLRALPQPFSDTSRHFKEAFAILAISIHSLR